MAHVYACATWHLYVGSEGRATISREVKRNIHIISKNYSITLLHGTCVCVRHMASVRRQRGESHHQQGGKTKIHIISVNFSITLCAHVCDMCPSLMCVHVSITHVCTCVHHSCVHMCPSLMCVHVRISNLLDALLHHACVHVHHSMCT